MGAWGTGLFCDDVACDIRTHFRDLLADGRSVPQTTRQILAEWREAVDDEDDGPVIWLALASLQWDCGALQPRVKSKALRIIDGEADLQRWRSTGDAKLVRQRRSILKKLREKLDSPRPEQPAKPPARPKQKRKRFIESKTNWPLGEVFAYQLLSGQYILLHVCDYWGDSKAGFDPIFALLDWRGERLPDEEQILQLPLKRKGRVFLVSVGRTSERELPQDRIRRLGIQRERHVTKVLRAFYASRWKWFDDHLREYLNWS